ncbi:MAG: hypothetical protein KAS30_00630, partial [Candidatus Diapherotrites archaeon]|nr:hypothetical protein [Candidatus Diapherotrites archaeon]
ILGSAMLHELDYAVALLRFPNHMAVGIKCDHLTGQAYYSHKEVDYCYLETTGKNWAVGKVPLEHQNKNPIVIPIVERAVLDVDFRYEYEYDQKNVYVDVFVTVKNLGSKTATNTTIYVSLDAVEEGRVWDQIKSDVIEIKPESTYTYKVKNLNSPTGKSFRVFVQAGGGNVLSDETVGDWINWK